TAEVKDFIAPTTANITNCGTINIHKQDSSGNPLQGASFQLFAGSPNGTVCSGAAITPAFTCTTDAAGNCSMTSVPFGTYCLAEPAPPANFLTANAQSATICSTTDTITLTFVDVPKPGAILISKTSIKGNAALAGATFTVTNSAGMLVGSGTSDANGQVCVTGLTNGATFTVTETSAPTGYSIDTTSKTVT